MKWYKLRHWWTPVQIEPVEVERSTDCFVWVQKRRVARASSSESYFSSWQEAHEYLQDRALSALVSAKQKVIEATKELERIEKMAASKEIA